MAASIAGLKASTSASSATSCVFLMTSRSAAETPARFVWSIAANRELASSSAVPAVPPLIWMALYVEKVKTLPSAAAVTAAAVVTAATTHLSVTVQCNTYLISLGLAEYLKPKRSLPAAVEEAAATSATRFQSAWLGVVLT